MGLRRRSIRLRIFLLVAIPILSLIGLYAFAATSIAGDAINLARSRTVKNTLGTPIGNLEAQAGTERQLAVVYLAAPAASNLAALRAQEHKTNLTRARLTATARSGAVQAGASAGEKQAIRALLRDTGPKLGVLRSQVARQAISRPRAISGYTGIIVAANRVLNQLVLQQTNVPLVTRGLALLQAARSQEILLQENALLTGDALARTFRPADRRKFTELVGARRNLYAGAIADMQPAYRAYYLKDIGPRAIAALDSLENRIIAGGRAHGVPAVPLLSWQAAVIGVSTGILKASNQGARELIAQAEPVAHATYLRLIIVGGLGLLAVLASILVSFLVGRGLLGQLGALRRSALELATERLPTAMARLRAGQEVDLAAEVPPLDVGTDEIGQVRAAFNAVQRAAVESAAGEAKLRRGVSDIFRNLARRSQSLLHRQLALLDAMERRATEPGQLDDLYRIDHLATRMRRHSESLIILAGESPGRGWRHPVPLVDVLRAGVAEVEDYARIKVTTGSQAALAGPAVADVIHLLAELAENATIFSPPNTPVRIHGDVVGKGFAVEIEDRGLGMTEDKLAEVNRDLAGPRQFDLSGSDQLGLFVAGQLASRHGIQITLRPSPYGGITAIVVIPKVLVVDEGGDDRELPVTPADERAIRRALAPAATGSGVPLTSVTSAAPTVAAAPAADPAAPPAQPAAPPTSEAQAATPAVSESQAAAPTIPYAQPTGPAVPQVQPTAPTVPQVEAAAPAVPAARAGGPDSTTDPAGFVLPQRVRQASLAPQPHAGGPPADAEGAARAPSPEATRSIVAALQRGWERGREGADPGVAGPQDDTSPGAQQHES